MDRNLEMYLTPLLFLVALRKESVDRNNDACKVIITVLLSLSARRAWIEMYLIQFLNFAMCVALRKESVDRNLQQCG